MFDCMIPKLAQGGAVVYEARLCKEWERFFKQPEELMKKSCEKSS
jgi:hypothetical protein